MKALDKLKILTDIYDEAELAQILGKFFDIALSQHRQRLERHELNIHKFEEQYGMESDKFYHRFEAGELGDAMDFFEWSGLYELRQDIIEKIKRMEEPY